MLFLWTRALVAVMAVMTVMLAASSARRVPLAGDILPARDTGQLYR